MNMTKTKSILVLLAAVLGIACATAQVRPRVYINPGHGGHTSKDRNVVVPGYVAGDTAGFWESNASLKKGFALQELLKKKGYTTGISRIRNEEENDLGLSTIVSLSNSFSADVFFSLHSNATGAGDGYRINFPLGLYRGYTGQPQVAHSAE
ncbi:MAG: N-acetylmuramoyl-L-alanine amidase, partial [Bacteroidales bacterium]|nr:N-acetylmuramoyl-L-alanine amidase [Candidatus Sodaliphilus fimicaballi]